MKFQTALRFTVGLVIPMTLISPFSVQAEYNPSLLGEAAGAYINSTDMMEKIEKSKCSYIFKSKTRNFDRAVIEVTKHLSERDSSAFRSLAQSFEMQNAREANSRQIETILQGMEREGKDYKTACGMLVANAGAVYTFAEKGWRTAARKYGK